MFRYPDKPNRTSPTFFTFIANRENEWMGQAKYDGWRLFIHQSPQGLILLNRMGQPIHSRFPITPTIRKTLETVIEKGIMVDAELVGPRGHLEPCVYLFDLLGIQNEYIGSWTFERRWERLNTLKLGQGVRYAETRFSGFREWYEELRSQWVCNTIDLCEGLVLRRRNSQLILSARSNAKNPDMVKIKYREGREGRT